MKDTHAKSEVMSWGASRHSPPQQSGWDDAKPQQLSNLFHYNIIMSPHHDHHHEEEEEEQAPAVGEIVDFDDEPIMEQSPGLVLHHHQEYNGHHQEVAVPSTHVHQHHQQADDDVVSVDESVLQIAMFEAVLQSAEEGDHQEEELNVHEEEEEEISPLPIVVTIPASVAPIKRPANDSPVVEARPVKRVKKEEEKEDCKPAPKSAPVATNSVSTVKEVKIEEPRKMPPVPRRRRPNCLFVNHFGTRLNDKGEAVKVNTSVKTPEPARISSEESVSIRTKSTGRSSKSSSTKNTPVSLAFTATPSASRIPAVVSIVTPAVKKPIKSSCLEDITMEEDDMEPLLHEHPLEQSDDMTMTTKGHLPYVNSLTNQPTSPPTPGMPTARMMPGMMPGGIPPLNFSRPFPLLQRRAFLNSCHPMAGHPAGYGWPASPFPRPGMHFPNQAFSAPAPTPSSASSSSQTQWKNQS